MPCGQCMARASSRSILHVPHISKIPRRIRYDFKYFVKVIWKLIIGGAGLGGGILMKLGDKDISSTKPVTKQVNNSTHRKSETFESIILQNWKTFDFMAHHLAWLLHGLDGVTGVLYREPGGENKVVNLK